MKDVYAAIRWPKSDQIGNAALCGQKGKHKLSHASPKFVSGGRILKNCDEKSNFIQITYLGPVTGGSASRDLARHLRSIGARHRT